MPRLILVRHGPPVVRPGELPSTWPLDPESRMDVARLGAGLALSSKAVVVASTEQKAVDTAEALGIDAPESRTADLREVGKPWFDDPADHHVAAQAYLQGQPLPGWEPIEAAVARFQRAIEERLDAVDVVAVTHGTVMTTWLTAAGIVADGPSFWVELRLPDGWEVDLAARRAWRVA